MPRASLASMVASSAVLLAACGGLTDQSSSRESPGGDVTAPEGSTGAASGSGQPAAKAERVAVDVGVPSAIAVASDRVLFTTSKTKLHGELRDAAGLFVVHKRLGPALLVAMDDKGARFDALAVDAEHAYVATSDARLIRVPLAGGAETPIAELPAPAVAIAPAGNHVYFATATGVIERAPVDGVGAIEPVATVAGRPRAIAVDDQGAVYVATSMESEGGSIVKVASEGGEPTVLGTSAASPCAMTRAGHELFFTAESAVHRLLVEGGPPATVAAGASSACAIATDGADLWFAGGAGLMRAPAAGGQPIAVPAASKALATPGTVAVDASHVYWLEGTAVLRLAKPLR